MLPCPLGRCSQTLPVDRFISSGGWDLLFVWLQEAKSDSNFAFLRELLLVYQGLPVTLEHLRSNTCAKMIKQLSKTDDEGLWLCVCVRVPTIHGFMHDCVVLCSLSWHVRFTWTG